MHLYHLISTYTHLHMKSGLPIVSCWLKERPPIVSITFHNQPKQQHHQTTQHRYGTYHQVIHAVTLIQFSPLVCIWFNLTSNLFIWVSGFSNSRPNIYLSTSLPFYLSTSLPLYLSVYVRHLSTDLFIYLSIDQSVDPWAYGSLYLSICPSVNVHLSIDWSIHLSTHQSINPSIIIYPFVHPSVSAFLRLSVHPSIHLSIYLAEPTSVSSNFHFSNFPTFSLFLRQDAAKSTYVTSAGQVPRRCGYRAN